MGVPLVNSANLVYDPRTFILAIQYRFLANIIIKAPNKRRPIYEEQGCEYTALRI